LRNLFRKIEIACIHFQVKNVTDLIGSSIIAIARDQKQPELSLTSFKSKLTDYPAFIDGLNSVSVIVFLAMTYEINVFNSRRTFKKPPSIGPFDGILDAVAASEAANYQLEKQGCKRA
ncbi:hypothetical protein PENTCL1PPCAC_12448, partial [Pristionchus entomophagus]